MKPELKKEYFKLVLDFVNKNQITVQELLSISLSMFFSVSERNKIDPEILEDVFKLGMEKYRKDGVYNGRHH